MRLSEIANTTHKTKKIYITNNNINSDIEKFPTVMFKINLDTEPDTQIRFSLEENSDFIHHQQIESDFFFRIDNKPNSIIPIYVHYFSKELYDYEEPDLITNFNFNKIIETEIDTKKYYQENIINGKLQIQSLFNDNSLRNPNYKQITKTTNENDETQQGEYPLSSRYRNVIYNTKPNLTNIPKWEQEQNIDNYPYWQYRIKNTDLSPLINNTDNINIYMNYQYLPSSTSYHQHLFGFEGDDSYEEMGIVNDSINVFEGENLNKINNLFDESTYRLVKNNFYNNKYTLLVDKDAKEIYSNQDFKKAEEIDSKLTYYKCEDCYELTNQSENGYCTLNLDRIKKGKLYTLKYFIYIPDIKESTNINEHSCCLCINDETIPYEFREYDYNTRNQWIYHEIPFIGQETNKLDIYGFNDTKNYVYFTRIVIEEISEYSPTIKYSKNGVYVLEDNEYIFRPNGKEDIEDIEEVDYPKWEKTLFLQTPITSPTIEPASTKYTNLNNASIELRCVDRNGEQIINNGTIKCGIIGGNSLTNEYLEQIELSKNLNGLPYCKYIGSAKITDGKVLFNNLNLSQFTPNKEENKNQEEIQNPNYPNLKYYLKCVYTNECFVDENNNPEEHMDIIPIDFFKPQYTLDHEVLRTKNAELKTLGRTKNEYTILKGRFPIAIYGFVHDQFNNYITEGYTEYMELSVNDEFVQSTVIDEDGIADFYLSYDIFKDRVKNQECDPDNISEKDIYSFTIKIEYFNQLYYPISFETFTIHYVNCNSASPIELEMQVYDPEFNPEDNSWEAIDEDIKRTTHILCENKSAYKLKNDIYIIIIENLESTTNDKIDIDLYETNNLLDLSHYVGTVTFDNDDIITDEDGNSRFISKAILYKPTKYKKHYLVANIPETAFYEETISCLPLRRTRIKFHFNVYENQVKNNTDILNIIEIEGKEPELMLEFLDSELTEEEFKNLNDDEKEKSFNLTHDDRFTDGKNPIIILNKNENQMVYSIYKCCREKPYIAIRATDLITGEQDIEYYRIPFVEEDLST